MNQSFYIGALGAGGQQQKMNVIANNIANVNTVGFKEQYSVFSDLIYNDVRSSEGGNSARSGSGVKVDHTKTDFTTSIFNETGMEHDYAIAGEGFFMLKDPVTGDVSYTRDGRFHLSIMEDKYYLVDTDNRRVMNMDQEEITYDVKEVRNPEDEVEEEEEEEEEELEEGEHDPRAIGVFTFARRDGILNAGSNEFTVTAKNGEPILLEKAKVAKRSLETSGVNFAAEMARMMEAQRAYSYALKMVQTSDEIEGTINQLR